MDPDAAEVYRLDRPQVSPGLFEAIVGQVLICLSYPLAPNCEKDEILRVVVRESLSGDLSRKLIHDILQVYVLVGFLVLKLVLIFPWLTEPRISSMMRDLHTPCLLLPGVTRIWTTASLMVLMLSTSRCVPLYQHYQSRETVTNMTWV